MKSENISDIAKAVLEERDGKQGVCLTSSEQGILRSLAEGVRARVSDGEAQILANTSGAHAPWLIEQLHYQGLVGLVADSVQGRSGKPPQR